MKVLFADAEIARQHAFRGIGTYARMLRSALQKIQQDKDFHFSLAREEVYEKPDLIHFPHADLYFRTLFPPKHIPFVVTVHDVIPLVYPRQYFPGIKGWLRFLSQKKVLQQAAGIITDSQCSKKDIVKHLGISAKKVHVVPLAANPSLSPQPKKVTETVIKSLNIERPFFLYVGDMNFNKNLPLMVSAFHESRLHASLVLVGRNLKNREIPEGKKLWEAIESGPARVEVLTQIPSDTPEILSSLFSDAVAYVQPSLYEGFGLSVLDAFRCKCPVISSNASSLPEVYGDAAYSFAPAKKEEIIHAFQQAYAWTSDQRKAYIQRGIVQERKFSWLKTAQETVAVYQQIISARKL